MRGGHRLDPHALPDSGNGSVPNPAGFFHLLSARLEIIVGSVLNPDNQGVGSVLDIRSHIQRETGVTAGVRTDLDVIDKDLGLPIDSIEVEDQALPLPVGRNRESGAVPKSVFRGQGLADSRKGRLDGERHQYLPVKNLGTSL